MAVGRRRERSRRDDVERKALLFVAFVHDFVVGVLDVLVV